MKQVWTADELGSSWTLNHDEIVLVENRRGPGNRLGFALQLKHYQLYARFLDGYPIIGLSRVSPTKSALNIGIAETTTGARLHR